MLKNARSDRYNWKLIEQEWRAGQLSNCEIARRYGPNESTIRQRAKRNGWERISSMDLQDQVKKHLVQRAEEGGLITNDEIADYAAERATDIVISHRKDISRLRRMANEFTRELASDKVYPQASGRAAQRQVVDLPLSLKNKVDILKKLADVNRICVDLERQAYNIDSTVDDDAPDCIIIIDQPLERIDGSPRPPV